MAIALFDLDNTLLDGDSDYEWGQFMATKGMVEREEYERENARFYAEYKAGKLDIYEFAAFSLRPLAACEPEDLYRWREEFMTTHITPIMTRAGQRLIDKHSGQGDVTIIITATNSFVTSPIAELYGVDHLIATEPEKRNDRFTGRIEGEPCFREGKVARLEQWLTGHSGDLEGSWFYSDSINDLPLLEHVTHAVAVDADDKLARVAAQRRWPHISLRDDTRRAQ
ncbi:MAG: HAD family hydrolase [Gammaproteobacteria bacterium]